ncbi:MAG: glycosyltransferase family 39 protein [Pseudomonadota bacterium]|nr:glycosyltransferase family 39 protein [Pseudomonadota bacterium]
MDRVRAFKIFVCKCSWNNLLLSVIVIVALFSRFFFLEESPAGFYSDEAATAAQVLCLSETGHDFYGNQLPLFSRVLGGGFVTPTHLYIGVLWTKIFGSSIQSFRGLSAAYTVFTIFGCFFLARVFLGSASAFWVLLTAALSPWGFHFARIAWDPPLMPCFLVWGTFFFFRSSTTRDGFWAALFLSLALYTYPPARVQIPLLFLGMCFLKWKQRANCRRFFSIFFASGFLICVPLVQKILTGGMLWRSKHLSILNSEFLQSHGGDSWLNAARIFLNNFESYFSLKFLFVQGDPFLRYSMGRVGLLSYIDTTAVILGLSFLAYQRFLKKQILKIEVMHLLWLGWFGVACAFFGAALTNEYHPHTLRAIGGWPFLALLSGTCLAYLVKQVPKIRWLASLVSLSFVAVCFYGYFFKYPQQSAELFDHWVKAKALAEVSRQPASDEFVVSDYPALSVEYYRMHSASELRKIVAQVKPL